MESNKGSSSGTVNCAVAQYHEFQRIHHSISSLELNINGKKQLVAMIETTKLRPRIRSMAQKVQLVSACAGEAAERCDEGVWWDCGMGVKGKISARAGAVILVRLGARGARAAREARNGLGDRRVGRFGGGWEIGVGGCSEREHGANRSPECSGLRRSRAFARFAAKVQNLNFLMRARFHDWSVRVKRKLFFMKSK